MPANTLNFDPFHALADPSRRQILMMVSKERMHINSLAHNFDISRPAISKHIKILHEAGFISIQEQGRERYCELSPEGFEHIKGWIGYFEQFWNTKVNNLDQLLKQRKKKR